MTVEGPGLLQPTGIFDSTGTYQATVNSSGQLSVAGSFTSSNNPANNLSQTGAITTSAATVTLATNGVGTVAIQVTGSYTLTAGTGFSVVGVVNGTNYVQLPVKTLPPAQPFVPKGLDMLPEGLITGNGVYYVNASGLVDVQIQGQTATGTANFTLIGCAQSNLQYDLAATFSDSVSYSGVGSNTFNNQGWSTIQIYVSGASGTNTTILQVSTDGVNYPQLPNSVSNFATAGAGTIYTYNIGGYAQFKFACTAYTSGAISMTFTCSKASALAAANTPTNPINISQVGGTSIVTGGVVGSQGIGGLAASNSALAGNPIRLGASDGSLIQDLRVNPVNGVESIQIQSGENLRLSYSASCTFATAASATDVFGIQGSSSKVVRITRLEISGIGTTAISVPVSLIKRSAANTGGTSSGAMNIATHDANDTTPSATLTAYTANPSGLGVTIGAVRQARIPFPLTGATQQITSWDFGVRGLKPIVLRGVAQGLWVNFGSTTISGSSVSISIEWTEDAT